MARDYINHTRNSLFELIHLTYGPGVESIHDVVSKNKKPPNILVSCGRVSRAWSASGSDSLKSADSTIQPVKFPLKRKRKSTWPTVIYTLWRRLQWTLRQSLLSLVGDAVLDTRVPKSFFLPVTSNPAISLSIWSLLTKSYIYSHLSSLIPSCFTLMHADLMSSKTFQVMSIHIKRYVFEYSHMYPTINCNVGWIQRCSNLQQHQSFLALSTKFI